jgi:hypothetical protein
MSLSEPYSALDNQSDQLIAPGTRQPIDLAICASSALRCRRISKGSKSPTTLVGPMFASSNTDQRSGVAVAAITVDDQDMHENTSVALAIDLASLVM